MKEKDYPILLFLISLSLFLLMGVLYGDFLFTDEVNYLDGAERLLEGKYLDFPEHITGEAPSIYHRILHQIVITFFLFFHPNLFYLRIYPIIISSLTVVSFYHLLCYKFDKLKSLLGALLFSSIPLYIGLTPLMLADTIGLFFIIFGLQMYVKSFKSLKFLIISAFIFSLGFLFRETIITMVFAVFVHLMMKRKFKSASTFLAGVSILPLIFFLIFVVLNKPLPWITVGEVCIEVHGYDWIGTNRQLIYFLATTGIVGLFGLMGIIKKFYIKNFKPLDIIFLIYSFFCIVLILITPTAQPRYFAPLFFPLTYFTISYGIPKRLTKNFPLLILIIILFNYILAFFSIGIFLEPHLIEIDAVEWAMKNISKEAPIFTNHTSINYLLKYNGYNISREFEAMDYEYFILINNNLILEGVEEIQRFEAHCSLTWFRGMRCEKTTILIFGTI